MTLSDAYPTPWTSMREGRDHFSGDNFILTGGESPTRGPDLYINEDLQPASVECQDLIAASRTYLPALVREVRTLRQQLATVTD
jgi:hypothetical protein